MVYAGAFLVKSLKYVSIQLEVSSGWPLVVLLSSARIRAGSHADHALCDCYLRLLLFPSI